MRASQGVPSGRKVLLYNPELFDEYEEVIIYPQSEFKRNFMTIKDHINYSILKNWQFEMLEERKIIGYWLAILEHVQLIDVGMNEFFSAKASQSYLDAYLYDEITDEFKAGGGEVAEFESLNRVSAKSLEQANPLELGWP
jgi:hypothetical protein